MLNRSLRLISYYECDNDRLGPLYPVLILLTCLLHHKHVFVMR